MTTQLLITLAVLAFMIIMFVWQKFPMGVTTMTCCALLAAFGILSPSEAFSGFANNSIILVAPMMVLSAAITKTSVVPFIRKKVNSLSGKKGIVLILFFYLVVIAFVQFIPATATFSIMIVFLASLSNDGEVTPTRLLMPMLGISCAWKGFLPIGMGATSFATINARYETIITNENYWLQMFDKFKVSILPVVCLSIWCLVAWRLLPKQGKVDLIGNAILNVLGEHPSSLAVMFLFTTVTIVMTTVMSNSATSNVLYTVAATVCLAGNWDPRGIMLIVAIANVISLGFPSGAAETALIYAAGNYKVSQVAKFTIPYILIAIVTIALSANYFYPIYG